MLLIGEGCILALPPSVPYSKHQRVVEREAKEVLIMANKNKANELMMLVNIKGSTQAKSTINCHQKSMSSLFYSFSSMTTAYQRFSDLMQFKMRQN